MLRFNRLCMAVAIGIVTTTANAQTITFTVDPAAASLYTMSEAGVWTLLGTGGAKFKLKKESNNRLWLVAEGYDTTTFDFPTEKKWPKTLALALTTRLVKIAALPYDAAIYANGELKGSQAVSIPVPKGQAVTVEIRKPGFKTESRTYRFEPGGETPPPSERFELKDRLVVVQPVPDRANVVVDGAVIGRGTTDVVVPFDKCVAVTVEAEGFKPEEARYCNKAGLQAPRISEPVTLKDRMVALSTMPANADIRVRDKVVGRGSYNLVVPAGGCISADVTAPSYARRRQDFCDGPELPAQTTIELPFDDAYKASVQTDQANVNFTVEVGKSKTPDQAWRIVSQVVLSSFDVLENSDKETGYLRTAWEVTKFPTSIVRTRVIVKLGDTEPLKYIVKISSEHSDEPGVTVKDDEKFGEWDRLLNTYKDIINELQARLR